MTPAAWVMLVVTWSIVVFFSVKYFWMVLTLPNAPEANGAAGDEGEIG